jgi:hypothetical protein
MTTVEKDAVLHACNNLLLEIAANLRRDRWKSESIYTTADELKIVETQFKREKRDKLDKLNNFEHRASEICKSAVILTQDRGIPETFVIDDADLDSVRTFAQDFIL